MKSSGVKQQVMEHEVRHEVQAVLIVGRNVGYQLVANTFKSLFRNEVVLQ